MGPNDALYSEPIHSIINLVGLGMLGCIVLLFFNGLKAWKQHQEDENEFHFEKVRKRNVAPSESDGTIRIRSFSDSSEYYELKPMECRCSCPDWTKLRGGFPIGDPRRMCKHLIRQWCEQPEGFPKHLAWYADEFRFRYGIKAGFSPRSQQETLVLPNGKSVEIYRDDQKDWVNIFDGTGRYGFNPEIMKWANNTAPEGGREIIRFILDIGPDLLPGCIKTISRRPASETDHFIPFDNRSLKGCLLVTAEMEGVTITALINPRAGWQNMLVGGAPVDVDLREGRYNSPPHLMHLELALTAWAEEEREAARANLRHNDRP